ncbi:MAG: serine hydrolase domain-containing protein [Solirubrobacterales bacterium]
MKFSFRSTVALACATVALAAPAAAIASKATDRADARLDRALEKLVAFNEGPLGVSAFVQRGNRGESHTAGISDLKSGRAVRANDFVRLASTAKAFSGAVSLSLVEQGVLSIDSTIGETLPGQPAAWSQITLGQLLQHTSGIADFSLQPAFRARIQADPRGTFEHTELPGFVADVPLGFTPGTAYKYSNTDNILVGLIVESVTGDSYENQLAEQVYEPLGLNDTSLPSDWKMPKPFMHGYDTAEDPPEDLSTIISMSGVWASGGLVSTTPDVSTFARGYVGRELFGRSVQNRQLELVEGSSEPPGPGENMAGMAIFEYTTDCGVVYGHTGNTAGYTAFLASTLNGRRSVAVVAGAQSTPKLKPKVFKKLRAAEEKAVCAALAK